MPFVNREAQEPEERPTELGRHIWQTCVVEHPGEWREVYEIEDRKRAVYIEGCLIGRGAGRIAPILDLTGWDARLIERVGDDEKPVFVVRVRYRAPREPKKLVRDLDDDTAEAYHDAQQDKLIEEEPGARR